MACKIYETVANGSGGALALGAVVRISNDNEVTTAQADTAAHVRGTIGVTLAPAAAAAQVAILTNGKGQVLLENGLTPVAGDTLYVSETVAGRATNVKPTIGVIVGTIKDAAGYVTVANPLVFADVDVAEAAGAGAGQDRITLSAGESDESGSNGEAAIIYQWMADLSQLGSANVKMVLDFVGRYDAEGLPVVVVPVVSVRIGGTIDGAGDGTLVATPTSITPAGAAAYHATGTIVNPAAAVPVKVIMVGGNPGTEDNFFGLIRNLSMQLIAA